MSGGGVEGEPVLGLVAAAGQALAEGGVGQGLSGNEQLGVRWYL